MSRTPPTDVDVLCNMYDMLEEKFDNLDKKIGNIEHMLDVFVALYAQVHNLKFENKTDISKEKEF